MIPVTERIALDEGEIEETHIQAGGPGGQNVNKVASAVQLRFDVAHSPNLDERVRTRLRRIAGQRMTAEGVLVITARRFRTQRRNREDAYQRLIELVRLAAAVRKPRLPTRPSAASRLRRRTEKTGRSRIKRLRRAIDRGEE